MATDIDEGLERIDESWLKRTSRLSRTAAGVTARLAGAAIQSLGTRGDGANTVAAALRERLPIGSSKRLGT